MNDILNFKDIPQELKFNALFCGWKFGPNGKEPFDLKTGLHAKANDKTTFHGYPILLQNIHKYLTVDNNGKQTGGIGLGIFNGYSAVDIDHCINENGSISELAENIIKYCDSYTEYSPSKTGIRILFKTTTILDKNIYYIKNSKLGLEIYISDCTNKFVTITGNKISGDEIKEIDIQYILDKYMKKENNVNLSEYKPQSYDGDVNIDLLVETDKKLNSLWYSQAPGSGSNESELDLALCCKLAYYYHADEIRINKAFKDSPYYKSKDLKHINKWNTIYGINTIKNAIAYIGNSYETKPEAVTKKKSTDYGLNDTGNSERFVDTFGDSIRYNVDNEKWMLWNGKYWQYDIKDKIRDLVLIMAEKMKQEAYSITDLPTQVRIFKNIDYIYNNSGKNNLLKEAQHIGEIPVLNNELDKDAFLICSDTGVYNFETGLMLPFDKSYMMSQSMNGEVSFEKPVRFLKFLNEMFEGKEEMINYMHKALGYSATNSTREQCLWILHSDGNSGKSLLLDVISQALGSYAITSRPQLLTEQPNGNSNLEEIARLKGKRFIAVEEIKAGDKLNESLVKSLTSGIGNQVARFLYGNSFEFAVTGKIWMATNYEAAIKGTDRGIWRRIKVIPIYADFTGREDKDLKYKLVEELPQIRGWLLDGFRLYQKEGLNEPEEIKKATGDYKKDNDVLQKWIDDYCEINENNEELSTVLFENFNAYTFKYNFGKYSQTFFGREMKKKNFDKKVFGGKTIYFGIRIKRDYQDINKKVLFDSIKVSEDI